MKPKRGRQERPNISKRTIEDNRKEKKRKRDRK